MPSEPPSKVAPLSRKFCTAVGGCEQRPAVAMDSGPRPAMERAATLNQRNLELVGVWGGGRFFLNPTFSLESDPTEFVCSSWLPQKTKPKKGVPTPKKTHPKNRSCCDPVSGWFSRETRETPNSLVSHSQNKGFPKGWFPKKGGI